MRHEALRNVSKVGLIGLCVLPIDFHRDAAFLQRIGNAAVGGIQRIMFHELHDADGFRRFRLLIFTAPRQSGRHHGGHRSRLHPTRNLHFCPLGNIRKRIGAAF